MKIGIPRSLLYYYYYPFWQTLFSELGCTVILSEPTSTPILNEGVKHSISEICVPMKVYVGQVLDLVETKQVDLVYVPRFVSIKKGIFFCPKFMGLPDLIKHSLKGMEDKVLTHHITAASDDISSYANYQEFTELLGVSKRELKVALRTAGKKWRVYRNQLRQGYFADELLEGRALQPKEGQLTVGLLGYVYNVYDAFINMNLVHHLREMDLKVVTFEMLSEQEIEAGRKDFRKPMFWDFTNMLLGAGYHFLHSPEIDGIIHVTAFGCGPDSVFGPFLEIDSARYNKPYLTLRIDEHTGESHLGTRIEAFVDLLKLKRKREVS